MNSDHPSERTVQFLWLLPLVAVAIFVRLWHLGSFDVWTDELHTMQIARTGQYSFGPAYRTAPLNFMITAWAMRTFGDTVLVARAAPMLIGLLTVPVFVLLMSRFIGRRAALFGGFILAISSWHIYWSQNARHFALTTFFILLALYGFLAVWKDERPWGGALAAASLLLALVTHSSAGFYLAALMTFVAGSLIYRLWRPSTNSPSVRRHVVLLSTLLTVLAVYLPAYLSVGKYLMGNVAPWNSAENILGSIAFYISPPVAAVAAAGVAFLVSERDDLGWICLSFALVPLVLLTLASRFTTASAAYYLPTLISVATLVGIACDRTIRLARESSSSSLRLAAWLFTSAVFAAEAMDLALYHSFYRGLKPRWSDATSYVRANRRTNDLVLAAEADVAIYYLGSRENVAWVDQYARDLGSAEEARRPGGGIWYMVYASGGSPQALPVPTQRYLQQRTQLRRVFQMNYGPKDRTIAVYYLPPVAPEKAN